AAAAGRPPAAGDRRQPAADPGHRQPGTAQPGPGPATRGRAPDAPAGTAAGPVARPGGRASAGDVAAGPQGAAAVDLQPPRADGAHRAAFGAKGLATGPAAGPADFPGT